MSKVLTKQPHEGESLKCVRYQRNNRMKENPKSVWDTNVTRMKENPKKMHEILTG